MGVKKLFISVLEDGASKLGLWKTHTLLNLLLPVFAPVLPLLEIRNTYLWGFRKKLNLGSHLFAYSHCYSESNILYVLSA